MAKRIMGGECRLFIDQYGNRFDASSVRELRGKIGRGGSRVSKMYRDKASGTVHCGYVVGEHWLTAYARVEVPA